MEALPSAIVFFGPFFAVFFPSSKGHIWLPILSEFVFWPWFFFPPPPSEERGTSPPPKLMLAYVSLLNCVRPHPNLPPFIAFPSFGSTWWKGPNGNWSGNWNSIGNHQIPFNVGGLKSRSVLQSYLLKNSSQGCFTNIVSFQNVFLVVDSFSKKQNRKIRNRVGSTCDDPSPSCFKG